MNEEERIRTTIIAGRSVCEIVRFNNFKKSTVLGVKNCYDEFIAAGGKPDDFSSERKQQRRRSDTLVGDTVQALQEPREPEPRQIHEVPGERAGG